MTSTAPHLPAPPAAPRSVASPAVAVHNVHKAFRLPHQQYHTLKERALHPFRKDSYDVLQAVDDVTFEVAEGEFFGIVGRNGSGKSTLLKCLAGIYDIDAGDLHVNGRLSPFIELGVGFNMDLTARDNVMINAIMLGLTRQQARERFDDIIAFAELEEFLDLKLKNYSSGMTVRLAFSVAIQVDAEVLLIDEVLAVGDAAFQQKCFAEFHRLKDEGRTILFVTHDMSAVERFCDRAMLIEKGRMVDLGEPAAIARRYNELNFGRTVHQLAEPAEDVAEERFGDRAARDPRRVVRERRRRADRRDGARRGCAASAWRRASTRPWRTRSSASHCATTSARRSSPRPPTWCIGPTGSFAAGRDGGRAAASSRTGWSPVPTP